MELSSIIKTLFKHKLELIITVIAAVVFAIFSTHSVSIYPLKISNRAIDFGAADTQIMIDSPQSSLVDLQQETPPLSTRAAVYAQFMRSNAVVDSIAQRLGIASDNIVAQGPFTTLDGRQNITRPSEARSKEVRTEANAYRLVFDNQQDLPIVSIYAQAPSPTKAIALANASVAALRDYVGQQEISQNIPVARRTVVRELGAAQGGWVNNGVNPIFMALAFAGALVAGCLAILVWASVKSSLAAERRRRRALLADDAEDAAAARAELREEDVWPRSRRSTAAQDREFLDEASALPVITHQHDG